MAEPAAELNRERTAAKHMYWARSASLTPATTVVPKKLDAAEAAALEASAAKNTASTGAAWNAAQTFVEKSVSKWAHELLSDSLLPELGGESSDALPPAPAGDDGAAPSVTRVRVRVTAVETVGGDVTFVVSRGKQRLLLELELKLKVEAEVFGGAGDEMLQILTGKLTIDEVTGDDLGGAKMPFSKCTCDQKAWKPFLSKAAPAALWPPLKEALVALQEQGKAKWGAAP